MAKSKFPNRASDNKAVDNAQQVLRARYYDYIRGMGEEILRDAVEQGFDDYDGARDWIDDRVHESADGSGLVIYTGQALDTLKQSDNWLAIEDVGVEPVSDDLANAITVAAYYAVRADILEHIEAVQDEYFVEDDE
jgi:hypothetical protein